MIMAGRNIKKEIKERLVEVIREYENKPEISTTFGEPVIGYCNAKDKRFDVLFAREVCDHPNKIYRAGNTIIVFFVPYSQDIIDSNKEGKEPSEKWIRAYKESTMLIMTLNRAIREILEEVGRLVSCMNTPIDWIESQQREEWSFKIPAYMAGMGEFGTAGSFITEKGAGGRFSGIITDGLYFDPDFNVSEKDGDEYVEEMFSGCNYKGGANVDVSDECISSCPCGAISKEGVDRVKCQEYCKGIHPYVPSPDVCGKCFLK